MTSEQEKKIDNLNDQINKLLLIVGGAEEMGIRGLVQNFDLHIKEDKDAFIKLADDMQVIKNTKIYAKGILWTIGILWVIANVLISIFLKG